MFRRARRRRTLARHAIPDALWAATLEAASSLAVLTADELRRLQDLALLFLHEKAIEPAADFEVNDAMRVRIAALACRPILELGLDSYDEVLSVIVYPAEFLVRNREYVDEAGVVHQGDDVLSGEAWEQGPVILAWQDVLDSGRGDGFDVVAHEFAHKLDVLEGHVNGMPPLHRGMSPAAWTDAFLEAFEALRAAVDADEETWLDPYAAEDPGEFFAVCSELFFDTPVELRELYPAVYAQLSLFYRQDPGSRARR